MENVWSTRSKWQKTSYFDGTSLVSCCICWSPQHLPPACSVKHQVGICAWIITKLKAICLLLTEGRKETPQDILKTEPRGQLCLELLCQSSWNCFNHSSCNCHCNWLLPLMERRKTWWPSKYLKFKKNRKTVIIHGLQLSLHLCYFW